MLTFILKENSFQFNEINYFQTQGTKLAVTFANIFMSVVESGILRQSSKKPLEWKRYIDDIFSLGTLKEKTFDKSIEHANRQHVAIKFTAQISDKETTLLNYDISIYTFFLLPPTRGQ